MPSRTSFTFKCSAFMLETVRSPSTCLICMDLARGCGVATGNEEGPEQQRAPSTIRRLTPLPFETKLPPLNDLMIIMIWMISLSRVRSEVEVLRCRVPIDQVQLCRQLRLLAGGIKRGDDGISESMAGNNRVRGWRGWRGFHGSYDYHIRGLLPIETMPHSRLAHILNP